MTKAFHLGRRLGNEAAHEMKGTSGEAIHALKASRMLGAWYHRTFAQRGFKPGPFVAPKPPEDATAALTSELTALKDRLAALAAEAAGAEEKAALAEESRRAAEAEARAAQGDVAAALALAEESEKEKERYRARLAALQAAAAESSEDELQDLFERSQEAAALVVRWTASSARRS